MEGIIPAGWEEELVMMEEEKAPPILVDREWYERVKAEGGIVGSIVQLTEDEQGEIKATLLPEEQGEVKAPLLPPQGLEERVESIKFVAEVKKIQTTTDGGVRLTLDLPEDGRVVMNDLARCQQDGVYLTIEATKT